MEPNSVRPWCWPYRAGPRTQVEQDCFFVLAFTQKELHRFDEAYHSGRGQVLIFYTSDDLLHAGDVFISCLAALGERSLPVLPKGCV